MRCYLHLYPGGIADLSPRSELAETWGCGADSLPTPNGVAESLIPDLKRQSDTPPPDDIIPHVLRRKRTVLITALVIAVVTALASMVRAPRRPSFIPSTATQIGMLTNTMGSFGGGPWVEETYSMTGPTDAVISALQGEGFGCEQNPYRDIETDCNDRIASRTVILEKKPRQLPGPVLFSCDEVTIISLSRAETDSERWVREAKSFLHIPQPVTGP